MKTLFLTMWDAADRMRYKPDAYLQRVKTALRTFTFVGHFEGDHDVHLTSKGWAPINVNDDIKVLYAFADLSLDLWQALGKANILPVMSRYAAQLRALEQAAVRATEKQK